MYKRVLSVLFLFILILLQLPIWVAADLADVTSEFPLIPTADLLGQDISTIQILQISGLFIGHFQNGNQLYLGQENQDDAFSVAFHVGNVLYVATKNTTGYIFRSTDTGNFRQSDITTFDSAEGWNYKAYGLGDITYSDSIPAFTSRNAALDRLSELEAMIPTPEPEVSVVDLLSRTNELLAGLYLCVGVLVGVNLMTVLWRQVK